MSTATVVFDIVAKDKASRTFDSVGSKMKTLGKAGALAAGAGIVALGAGLISASKAALEDQKAQALLARQLKNSAGATKAQTKAVEDWISKQGIALGVTDDELRPALAKLVAVTHDVDKAQRLSSLAMNVSAGTGKSLSTVSAALAKAQLGNVAGLAKLGVATKNADGSTRSLEDITKDLASTYKGEASTAANTAEGKFGRLKLIFDETKESIGSKLLPVLSDMASWFLSKGLPAVQKFGGWLGDTFGPIIGNLVGWFKEDLLPALRDAWAQALPALRSAFDSIKKALHDLQPAFDLVGNIFANVLVPVLGWAAAHVLPLMAKQFGIVAKAIGALGDMGIWLWNYVFQPVFKFIVGGIADVLRWFGSMLQKIGSVPGMGWVGDLGDQLVGVADGAQKVADNLKKIPERKRVDIEVHYSYHGLKDPTRGRDGDGGYALAGVG